MAEMIGYTLFFIALIILGLLLYSVFCYAPGNESRKENADRCISCGEIVPEGRWVCPTCERKAKEKKDG